MKDFEFENNVWAYYLGRDIVPVGQKKIMTDSFCFFLYKSGKYGSLHGKVAVDGRETDEAVKRDEDMDKFFRGKLQKFISKFGDSFKIVDKESTPDGTLIPY